MQTITMYLRAASVKGTLVDEWNQQLSSLPALTRGLRAELILKLVDANGEPLPDEALAYPSWDFAVADDWDTTTAPQLEEELKTGLEGVTDLVIDLGKLEYISSSGLRIFLSIRKEAAAHGSKVIVRDINGDIRQVFVMTGFISLFEIQ